MKGLFKGNISLFILPLILWATSAKADLLLEPFVGYMPSGTIKVGASEENLSGAVFGARVGWSSALGLMLGVDYTTGMLKDADAPKSDLTPKNLGAFVGWDFPLLLRVWGVLGIKDSVDAESTSSKVSYDGTTSLKLGVGLTTLPFISLNAEYLVAEYESGAVKTKTSGIIVGASLPFEL